MSGITAFWLISNAESGLSFLGRDTTLTGRTELWPAVLDMIRQRPWLGYGYGGFWLGWEGESAHVWLWNYYELYLKPVHAHNGLLDLWLNLGLLGMAIFIPQFLLTLLRAVKRVRLTKTAEGLWPLGFLTLMLTYNITESSLLTHNNVFWLLYVTIALSIVFRFPKAGEPKYTGASLIKGTEARIARSFRSGIADVGIGPQGGSDRGDTKLGGA